MSSIGYENAPVPVRADIAAAHAHAWERLARAGYWLTAEERIAVAAEARAAPNCRLCRARKEALSPNAVTGTHDHLGRLSPLEVEVVHRIVTDPARLSESWYRGIIAQDLAEERYVEIVAVIAQVTAIDTFRRGIGMAPAALPATAGGTPRRTRPAGARRTDAWVPTIAKADHGPDEADLFRGDKVSNIRRALTLVPDEQRTFFKIGEAQYLPGPAMWDFTREYRAITHAQIELIAARVSAINQCFY